MASFNCTYTSMKWDGEIIMRCLRMYQSHTCLWDPQSFDYKNKEKRTYAMEEILRGLNINGLSLEMLKTKIHSLRNTYTNEKRKIERSKRDSSIRKYVPKIPWFVFADSFLGKAFNSRKSRSKMDLEEVSYDVTCATSLKQEVHLEDSNPFTTPTTESQVPDVTTVTKERENDFRPHSFDEIEYLKKDSFPIVEDELAIFGRSMVAQMRKLPEEYAVEIMSEIQNLLANKRLKYIAEKRNSVDYGARYEFHHPK